MQKSGSSYQLVGTRQPVEATKSELADTSQIKYQSTDSWQLANEHWEPTDIRQSTNEVESDLDEEPIDAAEPEPTTYRRRYPLRQRRAPCQFPDKESVLPTEEGKPESFEKAMIDTHNKEWYMPCKVKWNPCKRTTRMS